MASQTKVTEQSCFEISNPLWDDRIKVSRQCHFESFLNAYCHFLYLFHHSSGKQSADRHWSTHHTFSSNQSLLTNEHEIKNV